MHDIRLAIRRLRNAPAFTVSAVLTMAIGIGATVSIFAAYSAVLLKPIGLAIRLALGANPIRIVGGVVGEGGYLALAGVLGGGVISLLSTQRLSVLLFHVSSRDVGTFVSVTATLIVVVLLASYLAARRIMAIRSAAVLRRGF